MPYDGGWHPSAPKPPTSTLSGASFTKQLDKWASTGIIERDAADAIQWTADYVQKNDLSDAHFVLIGAGSAMGPCAKLLELGANVVAIDIPGSLGQRGQTPGVRFVEAALRAGRQRWRLFDGPRRFYLKSDGPRPGRPSGSRGLRPHDGAARDWRVVERLDADAPEEGSGLYWQLHLSWMALYT